MNFTEEEVDFSYIVIPSERQLCVLEMPHCEEIGTEEVINDELDRISGIESHSGWVIITSKKGRLLKLKIENMKCEDIKNLNDAIITSPPWKGKRYIYFEYLMANDTRCVGGINIPSGNEEEIVTRIIKDERGCDKKHMHWEYPVVPAYGRRLLLQSHQVRRDNGFVHMVERSHNNLIVNPIRLLQTGNLHLLHAGVYGNHLVCGDRRDITCLDLRGNICQATGNITLNTPVIGGPVFYKRKNDILAFFITIQGIECLRIN
jgi:hypothetical protein